MTFRRMKPRMFEDISPNFYLLKARKYTHLFLIYGFVAHGGIGSSSFAYVTFESITTEKPIAKRVPERNKNDNSRNVLIVFFIFSPPFKYK